jgi:hypothetical protein
MYDNTGKGMDYGTSDLSIVGFSGRNFFRVILPLYLPAGDSATEYG